VLNAHIESQITTMQNGAAMASLYEYEMNMKEADRY
jgi:hypothetical protein